MRELGCYVLDDIVSQGWFLWYFIFNLFQALEHLRKNDYCMGFEAVMDFRDLSMIELVSKINLSELKRYVEFVMVSILIWIVQNSLFVLFLYLDTWAYNKYRYYTNENQNKEKWHFDKKNWVELWPQDMMSNYKLVHQGKDDIFTQKYSALMMKFWTKFLLERWTIRLNTRIYVNRKQKKYYIIFKLFGVLNSNPSFKLLNNFYLLWSGRQKVITLLPSMI